MENVSKVDSPETGVRASLECLGRCRGLVVADAWGMDNFLGGSDGSEGAT